MGDRRRWTLHHGRGNGQDFFDGNDDAIFEEGDEVMPVSEHEELREAAQAAVDAYVASLPDGAGFAKAYAIFGHLARLREVLDAEQKERDGE